MATSSPFACAKIFLNILALLCVFSHATVLGYEASSGHNGVHKHMSIDDLRSVFQVDRHDQVPEYQVVSIRSRRSRRSTEPSSEVDRHAVHLEAFGRPFHLSLRPNGALLSGGALRVWTAHANGSSAEGVQYEEVPQGEIGELYQDLENEAALLVHRDPHNGALLVDGTIGSNLVVKPAPKSVRWRMMKGFDGKGVEGKGERAGRGGPGSDKTSPGIGGKREDDDEMFLDQEGEDGQMAVGSRGFPFGRRRFDYDLPVEEEEEAKGVAAANGTKGVEEEPGKEVKEHGEGLHIVYKRNIEDIDAELSDYAFMEPDQNQNPRRRKSRSVQKREAPYVIYPEILVIVDYDGYRLHGGDNVQIKRYFVSFWNGVDLRYKLLKGPKIRISIAGIIISRGRDATPYLERNRVGRDAIDSAAALTDMGKYLFRERRLPVYDIAVAVTKYDMCRRRKGGRCTKGTAGFAYVGGACVVNKRLEKVNSVAIIEDTGGFSGIIVAAHEVGHLLGAVHDGSPPPSYLGGPGAEKCRWEDGFIMSDLRHTERGFKWSPCSIASFHHFLNGETATCLYNSPHEDESLPRVLPGKLLSLDAQCRKDRGTSACFKDERVCAQLFCFDSGSGYCVAYRPAAEGSPCGDGQYCINGRCVAEHENIIPDYTQIMPSFLSRHGGDGGEETLATRPRPVFAPLANNVTHRH
ncbi:A disintegrin and metalloproteinase with thrombospondin motifs like isoform X2 [Hetaerina americana]|uniref:A disintegrin and metalloproteinase with thrombospondin motifs like isoform X2 n=1 Tax=Hetaerina americana TaxID=62018 RepID=UPI003A7F3C42